MRPAGDPVLLRELQRTPHHDRIACVATAGDVGGGNVRHDGRVLPQGPAPVGLAHVAIQVHGHGAGIRTRVERRLTWETTRSFTRDARTITSEKTPTPIQASPSVSDLCRGRTIRP